MTMTEFLRSYWGLDLAGMICDHCDWSYLSMDSSTRLCPHCGEGKITEFDTDTEQMVALAPPELVLGYRVGQEQARQIFERFIQPVPFAPTDLTADMLLSRLQRVYIPMWLVDGHVQAQWTAQTGYNYEVESHKSNYQNGQWRTQKVHETRVDWEDRMGQLNRDYDNVSAPALDEHRQLLQRLGDYSVKSADAYQADFVRKALVRLPNRSTDDAFPEAQSNFKARAAEDIKQATEAEGIRQFKWQADYSNLNWTQLLLPVLTSYYQDDDGVRRVLLINGFSGQPSGERLGSMKRAQRLTLIGIAITLVLIAVAVGLVLLNPELDDYVAMMATVAVGVGIVSLIPVFRVWRFNENEKQSN